MKTNLILKAALTMVFCCIIYYSCTNPDTNPVNPTLVGTDPVGPDRQIPYYYGDWMEFIDNNKYLSEITIPGTHDAGADLHTSEQGTESQYTIAQDFRISNQLLMGVRWFDIRLNDDDGTMTVYHGPYYLHKNFNDLILPTLGFLDSHPTEVVVFMIKQENSSRGDDAFANGVMGYLNWAHPGRFWMGDHIPQLSEVRGQVVIVRQFWGTHGYAMGVPLMWNDNTTGSFGSSDPGTYLYVQDHYSLMTVPTSDKIAQIEDCLLRAHNEPYPNRCYYLNFTSGERGVDAGQSLEHIASEINPVINTFLLSNNWPNNGVVFVNFAGGSDDGVVPSDLVKTLVNINTFTDFVTIGNQIWTNHNLNVTNYRNGDPIPNVTDQTEWQNLTTGAYCDYNNGPNDYGKLYNWYAVNDPRGLAPAGWHVASNAEWTTLVNYLGGASVAAGKLKDAGTIHWWSPNTGATNQVLFTAYPGGARWVGGNFGSCGETGMFWTSTDLGAVSPSIWMNFDNAGVQYQNYPKINGFSVRCIKD